MAYHVRTALIILSVIYLIAGLAVLAIRDWRYALIFWVVSAVLGGIGRKVKY